MKTSARSQFKGRMTHIRGAGSNCEVELTLAGGDRLLVLLTGERSPIMGIDWDAATEALKAADGVVTTVGIQAERPSVPTATSASTALSNRATESQGPSLSH
jgi:molybdate transport system regulatory protein